MAAIDPRITRYVRHFRQILLWPLQLMPLREDSQIQRHWELLEDGAEDHLWRLVDDEFSGEPEQFTKRHYSEFVTFLPYVQRFLYGDGKGRGSDAAESPIRVFRRKDVARVRSTYPDGEVLEFNIAHLDLYFFYDLDVVILVLEIYADNLSLDRVQETLYRFGRAYPTYWHSNGNGGHCMKLIEWLAADGSVLAVSDFDRAEKYLASVCTYRAPTIASHMEFVLHPMVLHHSDSKGLIRYRQLEYHRMPLMAYLALEDDPRSLTRNDFMRLAFVSPPGGAADAPVSLREIGDFESRYCYDRYWNERPDGEPGTRFLCCGEGFIMLGSAKQRFFYTPEAGLLEQFRHQYFLLFLIAHQHKASLLMLSDRLVDALNHLDIHDANSVRRFKRNIRHVKEIFLRFTHRYWFHEVSNQVQARELYAMTSAFLHTDRLYHEMRVRIEDMSEYLDSDSLRRQANTVVRLTVVTTFGLVGTTVTGYFGMNLLGLEGLDIVTRFVYFVAVSIGSFWFTFYTLSKSARLSDFLEALTDEHLSVREKFGVFLNVWRGPSKRL